ncbi:MAG: 1-deoxy-D-xylulose-5-phosphate synthase [Clostridia bacterium]|nr:1-deoxy-D-xylulose-5-phosphate synthase [Clostridia bacterium]
MLENISSADIKAMNLDQLNGLCEQLRNKIISTVMVNGGHLASNLGAVELTVALHYVFDFPEDKVIFDVGHQCYAHKLLTGRAQKFDTLRKRGGISGFPKREESEYDCYNTGHAGTSVSAALGMAKARDIKGENYNVIAVIGDGSFNNGLVYEAFNSLKPLNTNILLIVNDNGMSISPTVGSMHEYLDALAADSEEQYHKKRRADIFEKFGFNYDGVYDGNSLEELIPVLTDIKEKLKSQPIILHILTKKGKGYAFCEENPEATHGISDSTAIPYSVEYSEVLGKKLCEIAEKDNRIVAVTAAMTGSLGLTPFFEKYPDRAVDVGICEEHAAILCAAMAADGLKPYYAVYSTFLQRSFDEIIIDICSQNLPVTICADRAGVSGSDGETHQGVFDLSFLIPVPNITIAAPKDAKEFQDMLEFSVNFNGPFVIRYPRACNHVFSKQSPIEYGKWERLCRGDGRAAILACGERAITRAYIACDILKKYNIAPEIINARFIKPLDCELLDGLKADLIVTIEDNVCDGGFGSFVASYLSESGKKVKIFGYRDEFIEQGGVEELMDDYGLKAGDIAEYIKNEIG